MRSRCLWWIISVAFLTFILSACEGAVDITPNVQDTTFHAIPSTVFAGFPDAVEEDFDTLLYTCNSLDLFVYRISDGGAILNQDSSPVSCTTRTYTRTDLRETTIPLFAE